MVNLAVSRFQLPIYADAVDSRQAGYSGANLMQVCVNLYQINWPLLGTTRRHVTTFYEEPSILPVQKSIQNTSDKYKEI